MNVKSQVSIVDCSHLTSFLIVCFSDGGPPKERPRLQLAKRTAPAEGAAPASSGSDRPAPPAAKSNPFGNAKPVDRSERPERSADDSRENNRQIEEEPKSDRPAPPAKSDRPAPRASNPFGNAKPIDSTKREKEMEEKLRKTDISDDKPRSNQQKSQHRDEKTTTNYDEKSGGDESKKVRSPPPPKEIEEPPVSYSTFSVILIVEFL